MAILVPEQGTVSLGNSRINPADTYVRSTPQDVSSGFDALSRALSSWESGRVSAEAKAQAEKDALEKEKIPFYVTKFSQELEAGTVDEVQVGKRLPTQSAIIAAQVTEGIGKRQWDQFSRDRFETALRDDESIRTDPVKRKSFFDQLRKDAVAASEGREFYGAGAVAAVEAIINEYEGTFQREGAQQFQKDQEAEFSKSFTDKYRYAPATGEYGALLDFISKPESGGNYNAYYGNTKNDSVDFTNMTLEQVMQWQRKYIASGSPSSAVGRYQFIQTTFKNVVNELGIDPATTKFTPAVQDMMAMQLLRRRGLEDYQSGKITKEQFANRLAQEWAGLPVVSGSKAGRSFYDGDGLNKSGVGVDSFLSAIDMRGPSVNGITQIEEVRKRYSGISNERARELIVNNAISMAVDTGDSGILDRVEQDAINPETGQSFLLPEHLAKLEKARQDAISTRYTTYVQTRTIEKDQAETEQRNWRNQMTTKFVNGETVDFRTDARLPDGSIDTDKKKFIEEMQASQKVPAGDSAVASANLEDALLGAGTTGGYTKLMQNDPVLGEKVKAGLTPTSDEVRDFINRQTSINPSDKVKLIEKVDVVMEGSSVLRDPMVIDNYKNSIGVDVDIFVRRDDAIAVLQRNPNFSSQIRNAYFSEVQRQIRADIEEGKGAPRGARKNEIIDAAELKAKEMFDRLTQSNKGVRKFQTDTNTTPKAAPKGRWEVQNGVKRWIPE